MKKPVSSHGSAGSFKIPATKPGAIKLMCGLPGYMEIYTPHETFKIQTPESIDPNRTNPNAMWVNAKTHDVGCASPFIARTFVMASEVLRFCSYLPQPERDALMLRMHTIKETLLQCTTADNNYRDALAIEDSAIEASEFRLAPGSQSLEYFPVISDIEAKVTAFLVPARRVITEVCQIPGHFWKLSKQHSSLEHLLKKDMASILGSDHRLVEHLASFEEGVKRIIEFRNGQEHASTTTAKLHVKNYEMMATNQIRQPVWFLDGEEPDDIAAHMHAISEFLMRFAELTFVGCVDATLPEWPPMAFEAIDPVDPECPTRYRLTIDPSRLPSLPT
jgi:hypothetical protein